MNLEVVAILLVWAVVALIISLFYFGILGGKKKAAEVAKDETGSKSLEPNLDADTIRLYVGERYKILYADNMFYAEVTDILVTPKKEQVVIYQKYDSQGKKYMEPITEAAVFFVNRMVRLNDAINSEKVQYADVRVLR